VGSASQRAAVCVEVLRLLNEERIRQGVSLNALAVRAGLSQSQVSRLGSATASNPTLDSLLRLAEALGINAGGLLVTALANVQRDKAPRRDRRRPAVTRR
jgi:transcriptional regulator with XRE-family HTH domain